MVTQFTKLRVFVASPGDTLEERACLTGVMEALNRGIAADRGFVLELVKWETHAWPGAGLDAQAVINREIDTPDILIAIFWKRLRPRTCFGDSALGLKNMVFLYFRTPPIVNGTCFPKGARKSVLCAPHGLRRLPLLSTALPAPEGPCLTPP
jgi:hypothetical protein